MSGTFSIRIEHQERDGRETSRILDAAELFDDGEDVTRVGSLFDLVLRYPRPVPYLGVDPAVVEWVDLTASYVPTNERLRIGERFWNQGRALRMEHWRLDECIYWTSDVELIRGGSRELLRFASNAPDPAKFLEHLIVAPDETVTTLLYTGRARNKADSP